MTVKNSIGNTKNAFWSISVFWQAHRYLNIQKYAPQHSILYRHCCLRNLVNLHQDGLKSKMSACKFLKVLYRVECGFAQTSESKQQWTPTSREPNESSKTTGQTTNVTEVAWIMEVALHHGAQSALLGYRYRILEVAHLRLAEGACAFLHGVHQSWKMLWPMCITN